MGKACFVCKKKTGLFKTGASKKWIENYHGIPPAGMGNESVLCHECLKKTYGRIFATKKKSFKVTFKNQSNLTIVMGILTILGSFGIFAMPMGGSGSSGMDFILKLIIWILFILFGVALISLGTRKVPNYDTFFDAIADFVETAVKDSSKEKEKEES